MGDKLTAIIANLNDVKDVIGISTHTSIAGIADSLLDTKSTLVEELTEKDVEASMQDTLDELVNKVDVLTVSPSVNGTELVFGQGTGAEVEGSELSV